MKKFSLIKLFGLQIFVIDIIIILFIWEFFKPSLVDGFHWSLSDTKSRLVFRTLPSILANIDNATVVMVSTRSLISKSSSPSTSPSVTVWWHQLQLVPPSLSCSIVFFSSRTRSWYSPLFSLFITFTMWPVGTTKSMDTFGRFSIFYLFLFFGH